MSENKVFNLDKWRLQWAEYTERKRKLKEHKAFTDEAADLLKQLAGDAKEFRLGGQKVAMVVAGQLNKTLLAKEQPNVIEKYTRLVSKNQFDEAWFREEEPELYEQYRAQRLVLSGETE